MIPWILGTLAITLLLETAIIFWLGDLEKRLSQMERKVF